MDVELLEFLENLNVQTQRSPFLSLNFQAFAPEELIRAFSDLSDPTILASWEHSTQGLQLTAATTSGTKSSQFSSSSFLVKVLRALSQYPEWCLNLQSISVALPASLEEEELFDDELITQLQPFVAALHSYVPIILASTPNLVSFRWATPKVRDTGSIEEVLFRLRNMSTLRHVSLKGSIAPHLNDLDCLVINDSGDSTFWFDSQIPYAHTGQEICIRNESNVYSAKTWLPETLNAVARSADNLTPGGSPNPFQGCCEWMYRIMTTGFWKALTCVSIGCPSLSELEAFINILAHFPITRLRLVTLDNGAESFTLTPSTVASVLSQLPALEDLVLDYPETDVRDGKPLSGDPEFWGESLRHGAELRYLTLPVSFINYEEPIDSGEDEDISSQLDFLPTAQEPNLDWESCELPDYPQELQCWSPSLRGFAELIAEGADKDAFEVRFLYFDREGVRKALRYNMYPDPKCNDKGARYMSYWTKCTNAEEKSLRFWVP